MKKYIIIIMCCLLIIGITGCGTKQTKDIKETNTEEENKVETTDSTKYDLNAQFNYDLYKTNKLDKKLVKFKGKITNAELQSNKKDLFAIELDGDVGDVLVERNEKDSILYKENDEVYVQGVVYVSSNLSFVMPYSINSEGFIEQ